MINNPLVTCSKLFFLQGIMIIISACSLMDTSEDEMVLIGPQKPTEILGIRWIAITPGKFAMGSNYSTTVACNEGAPPTNLDIKDKDKVEYCKRYGPNQWFIDESPIKIVNIDNKFWISDTEITVGQFREFVKETNYLTVAEKTSRTLGESLAPNQLEIFRTTQANWKQPWPDAQLIDNYPVVHVAWEDAQAFCSWLSKKLNRVIRLPSQAEWEYAAKANIKGYPTGGAYAWGQDDPHSIPVGNFADKSFGDLYKNWRYPVDVKHDDGFARIAPVRSYAPNHRGIYDLSGNVWEWTSDRVLTNNSENVNYIMRGGSFDFELPFLRVEKRRSLAFVKQTEPVESSISVGFRVVANSID